MNIALLMMGGSGNRFQSSIPKQFYKIKNKPIFIHILEAMQRVSSIDLIIVVVNKNWLDYTNECLKNLNSIKKIKVTTGGATRSNSVLNGLIEASKTARKDDVVMMFDTTHPYVDEKGIDELIEAVKTYGGATLGQRQFDTCYMIDKDDMLKDVIPREEIVSGASPEGFLFDVIYNIYKNATEDELNTMTSAGAIALKYGVKMKIISLNTINLKITYPEDIEMLEKMEGLYFREE